MPRRMRLSFRAFQGFLLLALVLRAFIPVGYMPSADRPFTLELCPDGFPVELLSAAHEEHVNHGFGPAGSEHAGHDSGPANSGTDHADHGAQPAGGGTHPHDSFLSMHCVFAAVASATPPQLDAIAALAPPSSAVAPDPASPLFQAPRFRTQQPRAPPALS